VIEDDARDREWLASTLRQAGYEVETASRGAEAIAKCRERIFGAITLDVLLPDTSGWEVLAEIRSTPANVDVPVIAVTVCAEENKTGGFRLHDYLVKPVPEETLLASLRRAQLAAEERRSILVVDDDPATLKLAEATFKHLGYKSVCCSDGVEALRAARADPPAVLVLDLLMPGMDGFEFLERFRQTRAGRSTPTIVWTVKELSAEERTTLRASAQAVVSKSVGGTEALVEELRQYLAPQAEAADAR
jgi:CheY-like chemotaxis protein